MGRIKNVLTFTKPNLWGCIIIITFAAILIIGIIANRADNINPKDDEKQPQSSVNEEINLGDSIDYVHKTLGEPIGQLSGLWGEIYSWKDGRPAIIYYGSDGIVEHIKYLSKEIGEEGSVNLKPDSLDLSPDQIVGADMTELDYASDDIVIFHDYYGLFVYDLNTRNILCSLDLKPIGCSATQGDDYCEVTVSTDGDSVQLHPLSSEKMYVYTVSDNSLLET